MRRLFAVVAIAVVCIPSQAQVAARQGTPDALAPTSFRSPMILEVPFDPESWPEAYLRTASNSVRRGRRLDLGEHSCDGVVVEHVAVARYKQRKGVVHYWVEVGTYTQPGIDKLAMVTVEILRDSSSPPEAKVSLPKIDAEENQHGTGRVTLSIPENLVGMSPPPTLRITVSVRDNP